MTNLRIHLIRHGSTAWSESGQHTGTTDLELNDEGEAQAKELSDYVEQQNFVAVFASPLKRALATAELAGCKDIVVLDQLREWNYGDYEGLTTAAIRELHPKWDLFDDGVPGGESSHDVGARADLFLREVQVVAESLQTDNDETEADLACFAHAHVLRVVVARWLGLPAVAAAFFHLDPASVSVLSFERERRVVSLLNARPANIGAS